MDNYQTYIHLSKYARWNDKEKRREKWDETVKRVCMALYNNNKPLFNNNKLLTMLEIDTNSSLYDLLYEYIYNMGVMPSMRIMAVAGNALDKHNIACYNCAYLTISDKIVFSEILYILMHGTGIGFSIEKRYVDKLPIIPNILKDADIIHVVADSKEGWMDAYTDLIDNLYNGNIINWDLSNIRPKGERLKTFGGRSPGAEPLLDLKNLTIDIFKKYKGGKLSTVGCFDLICYISNIVNIGGQRRSALLSLIDKDDFEMLNIKTGDWYKTNPYRAIANISIVYESKPSKTEFNEYWDLLKVNKSGEPGIFNREAALKIASDNNRAIDVDYGCNPCSEVILKDQEFCNLSEIIIRPDDNEDKLILKTKIATILGTLQSTYTNFNKIRPKWKSNCDEERLLGVSMTGIMDNELTNNINPKLKNLLINMKKSVKNTNIIVSNLLNINPSKATTCIKPSGTCSQLVNVSSGIHPRHSKYYIRSVRESKNNAISELMIDSEMYYEDDHMNPLYTNVFFFPIKSPEKSIIKSDYKAIDLIDISLFYQQFWCEHKISMTISIKDDEWDIIQDKIYENFDKLPGITFFPENNYVYKQMPYEECTKEVYESKLKSIKYVNWDLISEYENQDYTTIGQELACVNNECDV